MIRVLVFVSTLALLIFGSVWLADRPGAVAVEWLGWRLQTSVPVLLLLLLLAAGLLTAGLRFFAFAAGWPGRWADGRRESRQRRGYLALTDGLAAAASGDAKQARQLAEKAEKLLGDPGLTGFLSAQAAHLSGNSQSAQDHFQRLLQRPQTAAIGLRGLLDAAVQAGDLTKIVDLAGQARAIRPDDPWLAETLFTAFVKLGRWTEAESLLTDVQRRKAMPVASLNRRRALVLTERAGAADPQTAIGLARKALSADPSCTAAALRLADLYRNSGALAKAATILEKAWRSGPATALADSYGNLHPDEEPLARVRRLEKLVASHPDHVLSHLAVAQACLKAQLWGQARKHLLAAVAQQPVSGTFRLLAELEKAEYKDQVAAQAWLVKAAEAPADPVWTCAHCGVKAPVWTLLCPGCQTPDSLNLG